MSVPTVLRGSLRCLWARQGVLPNPYSLPTEGYQALIDVCEINRQRNEEDHAHPRSAPVFARRNRGGSEGKNEMSLFASRILLAIGGSEEADLALRVAVELAKSTGAELYLVHVKLIPITPPCPEVLDWKDDLERADREARELLDEQVKKVEEAGGAVAGIHLREERLPADEIVTLAEELGVSLIVVGSRNRGRTRRALAGGVSDWVVRHAPCPVLVVRSHKRADNRARLCREEHGPLVPRPPRRLAPGVEAPGEEGASSTA
jgi:nucleotide-binding universal stress UspA family protein